MCGDQIGVAERSTRNCAGVTELDKLNMGHTDRQTDIHTGVYVELFCKLKLGMSLLFAVSPNNPFGEI